MPDVTSDSFMLACPTVPVIRGSEVRFSIEEPLRVVQPMDWPLAYVSCGEIAPPQVLRTQWGISTAGPRYDSYTGFRLGNARTNLTLGARKTYANADSPISPVEQQRVGVAALTLGGRVRFKYWNDHRFWWWPMGDGGDQGDTAGLQFAYNLRPHELLTRGWTFENVSLTLRLATGIPNRSSAKPMGDGAVYSEVRFSDVSRGDLELRTELKSARAQRLEIGILVNSGQIRHVTQNKGVHDFLAIPQVPANDRVDVMMYLRLTNW